MSDFYSNIEHAMLFTAISNCLKTNIFTSAIHSYLVCISTMSRLYAAQSAGAVEYTDCISAEE